MLKVREGHPTQRKTMKKDLKRAQSLRELEEEVLAEGREWTRQRLQQRLQEEAESNGGVFPPQRPTIGAPPDAANAAAHRRRGR